MIKIFDNILNVLMRFSLKQLYLDRVNTDLFALVRASGFKYNPAACFGEESVIATTTNIDAGANMGAALADDDVACHNSLTAEAFYAQSFGFRIAAISGAAACLFMCHFMPASITTLTGDTGDFNFGITLTMSLMLHMVLATLEFNDAYLPAAAMGNNLAAHFATIDNRAAYLAVFTVCEHQNLIKLDNIACFGLQAFNANLVTF